MQVALCIMMRRVYLSFKVSLEQYIDFLLMFEETPRSKIAKKYLPPMDVLEEETTSMFNETVRTSSRLGDKFRRESRIEALTPSLLLCYELCIVWRVILAD